MFETYKDSEDKEEERSRPSTTLLKDSSSSA